ncbi:MAG: hypothetical protein IK079_05395, partial [Desulfovibrio sp.]|nr:hypothetical protein [Desulfovibrio sp.]
MQYSFLRFFPQRMKVVGLYAVLLINSVQKQRWKDFGFEESSEQINLLFAVLLFIMEQSLKEEHCTIDAVTAFIDDLNQRYFQKHITLEQIGDLADLVVNRILSNGGEMMHFQGYDFEKQAFEKLHISYVANKSFFEGDVRRTSYYPTENGYSLLLGTLEVENNMRLTIQEIILNEHLKKQNYDQALDDVKNIFELMRIEKLKNEEAISKIRQNVLNFSVEEYGSRIDETFKTIYDTRRKLLQHRDNCAHKAKMLNDEHVDVEHMPDQDMIKLFKLQELTRYLDRSLDCHMDIMRSYNNYRAVCSEEMEKF